MLVEQTLTLSRPDGHSHDIRFYLDPEMSTQCNILAELRNDQFYDGPSSRLALALLRPGDTFLDIGAHVGWFALIAAPIVGGGGRILAFEPNPDTFRGLLRNVLANRGAPVIPLNCAVGARNESLPFYINADNEGGSALWDVSLVPSFVRTRENRRRVAVPVITLDSLAADGDLGPVRLIKIDAEGWEPSILDGAAEFFRTCSPDFILCEINRGCLAVCGSSEADLRATMAAKGYDTFLVNRPNVDICGDGQLVRRLAEDEFIDTQWVFNVLFCRRDAELGGGL